MAGEKIVGKALDIVTFLLDVDKEALWDLSPHKEKRKRTLSSNNYYWNLLEDLAVKTKVPKMKIHNLYLRQIGLREIFGGKAIYMLLPDDDSTEEQVLLSSTYHLSPLRQTKIGSDKKQYRWYVMLKGSRDMTVEQFSMLVDMAVQDAKEQGIETLTPQELLHIRELEKSNELKKIVSIVTDDTKHCYICKKYLGIKVDAVHEHHMIHGTANRSLADKDHLVCGLCAKCHRLLHDNNYHNLDLQQDAERAWLKEYNKTTADFIARYGMNFLEENNEQSNIVRKTN